MVHELFRLVRAFDVHNGQTEIAKNKAASVIKKATLNTQGG